ncbi:MAG: sulfite exporter TauE/SafE family protein [Acidobacteria bacterium]|nr:sulfite exporter TauE/SafE family protein [Acidobacteriota bacterium]
MLIGFETVVFGVIAGLALGLTGGGGATIAVPLLVYGLGLPVPQAVAISLLAVGGSAIAGFGNRGRRHDVDAGAGAMLAGGGVAAAPVGAWLGELIPDVIVLVFFGVTVTIVSVRMWQTAHRPSDMTLGPCAIRRRISWRCISVLSLTGITTGLLSGILGVGGGFILVPAIVFATGMEMHRAVATSLMVTSIVSASAFISMLAHGRDIPWPAATLFLAGGLIGMAVGTVACRWISGVRLKQAFAILLGLLGVLVIVESLFL